MAGAEAVGWAPTSVKLTGTVLFADELESALEERFRCIGNEVARWHFAGEGRVSRLALRSEIIAAAVVKPLELGEARFAKPAIVSESGSRLLLACDLDFAGDAQLWFGHARSMHSAGQVVARPGDKTLTIHVRCLPDDQHLGELALASELTAIEQHVAEQADVLRRYHSSLRRRAVQFVQGSWEEHVLRRSDYQDAARIIGFIERQHAGRMAEFAASLSGEAQIAPPKVQSPE